MSQIPQNGNWADNIKSASFNLRKLISHSIYGVTTIPVNYQFSSSLWKMVGLQNTNLSSNLSIPNVLLFIGGVTCGYHFLKEMSTWFMSFFNAKKYLSPVSDKFTYNPNSPNNALNESRNSPGSGPPLGMEMNQKSYAVVYGAGNKAGKSFSYYLMQKGFNLILIERDFEQLQQVEDQLRRMVPDSSSTIVRIVLNKFDIDTINRAVGEYATFPVKIFVNCKSSKKTLQKKLEDKKDYEERRRAIMKDSIIDNDPKIQSILAADEELSNFEISTRAEIHYTGKENIHGFVALLNIFLRSMMMTSKKPCFINVDNVDGKFKKQKVGEGQLFYHATIGFKDIYTEMLGKKMNDLKTITVKLDFNKLPEREISHKLAYKLCNKTFSYIGLKQTITA